MSMQAASLEALEKANVSTTLARALAQVFEFEFAARKTGLATEQHVMELRQDIAGLGAETKQEFVAVRTGMKQEFAAVRTEMKQESAALRAEMKQESATLRAEIKQESATLRLEMKQGFTELRAEMKQEAAGLRTEIHATSSNNLRQMYMALLAQMAVLLGVVYFFFTHIAGQ